MLELRGLKVYKTLDWPERFLAMELSKHNQADGEAEEYGRSEG